MKSAADIRPIGCILAGGLSTRMQGPEKTLMPLGGEPMVERIAKRLAVQVDTIVINANGDPERFGVTGLPVQADIIEGFAGPLAGVHAGMVWAKEQYPSSTHLLTVAGDTPFFPEDLLTKLAGAVKYQSAPSKHTIALAYSDGNRHPTFGLWHVALANELQTFLEGGDRKVMLFAQRHNLQKVEFPLVDKGGDNFDPFFNVNTPQDFAHAEHLLGEIA